MAIYRFKISFEDYDEVEREIDIKSIQTFELLESKLNPGAVYVIEDVYFNFYDSYIKDGRFEMIDLRDVKGRGDDILAVYYKR
jgi:hypothetical protein